MQNKNHANEHRMNRTSNEGMSHVYKHFGSATISLAELDEYHRLIRREIVKGRAIRRRREQWMHSH